MSSLPLKPISIPGYVLDQPSLPLSKASLVRARSQLTEQPVWIAWSQSGPQRKQNYAKVQREYALS
ncbi:MAG: hypothetical protein NTX25_12290, partial [Proteobacteria bacterium]|nr:hypothetical protein [Pseudomonadota bacterium]